MDGLGLIDFARERPMKRLGPISTRRQLFRVMAAGAASVPVVALAKHSVSCLLKGTRISTPSGDRLVQELQIGDEVRTLSGRKTIKWIGYNKFTKEDGRAWQDSVMPVRVAQFAIDDHTPHRDLYLSPGHYIFFNQVLIPAQYLINEISIAQRMPSERKIENFRPHGGEFGVGAGMESAAFSKASTINRRPTKLLSWRRVRWILPPPPEWKSARLRLSAF
jgi:Hint domain